MSKMSKLESLYFKLNPDNEKHKVIIDFFNDTRHMLNQYEDISKIDLLYDLIKLYFRTYG